MQREADIERGPVRERSDHWKKVLIAVRRRHRGHSSVRGSLAAPSGSESSRKSADRPSPFVSTTPVAPHRRHRSDDPPEPETDDVITCVRGRKPPVGCPCMHKGYEQEPPTDRIATVRIERGIKTGPRVLDRCRRSPRAGTPAVGIIKCDRRVVGRERLVEQVPRGPAEAF